MVGAHPNQRPGCPHLNPGWVHTPISGLAARENTPEAPGTEHLPPSPCVQSSAGLTRSLGGRQNAQQRGATGLGETAVPRKT